jgi:hypothetical protein
VLHDHVGSAKLESVNISFDCNEAAFILSCARTVRESIVFRPFELALSWTTPAGWLCDPETPCEISSNDSPSYNPKYTTWLGS